MNEKTIQDYSFWKRQGIDDLWMMESYCMRPSCRIKNLRTGEMMDFGVGGITARSFDPVPMDKELENQLIELFRK